MEASNTFSKPSSRRVVDISEREQIAFLAYQDILKRPGVTTEQLADEFWITEDEMRSILIRHLKAKGKIKSLGWTVAGNSCRTNEPLTDSDNSYGTNKPLEKDSYGTNLKIVWQKAAGTAKTDHKYPWLCDGDRRLIYIGGGHKKNPIALERVAKIHRWIENGVSADEIVENIKKMKTGKTTNSN